MNGKIDIFKYLTDKLRFMSLIERVLSSKSRVKLLRLFHENPKVEFTLYELKKIFKLSPGTMNPVLKSLAEDRILLSKRVGKSIVYELNSSNLLVKKLLEIFDYEKLLLYKKAEEFVKKLNKTNVISIILFGSVATGKTTELSDIDLLIVYEKNQAYVKKSADDLSDKLLDEDIYVSPLILSKAEIKSMFKGFNSFILRVGQEGKLLYGKSLERLTDG